MFLWTERIVELHSSLTINLFIRWLLRSVGIGYFELDQNCRFFDPINFRWTLSTLFRDKMKARVNKDLRANGYIDRILRKWLAHKWLVWRSNRVERLAKSEKKPKNWAQVHQRTGIVYKVKCNDCTFPYVDES